MTNRWLLCLALGLTLIPATLAAQPLGFGARIGTLGVGAEAALDLGGPFVARGGVGHVPVEPAVRMSGIDWSLELPTPWFNAGLDLYLNGALRLGGGVLFKSKDPKIVASLEGPVTVGGRQFTPDELGSLTGTVESGRRHPYVLLGVGRHTTGSGLFLDVGMVWFGDSEVRLESTGGSFADQTELDARLRQGESEIEADLGAYLKVWPILSIGARIAVG